MAANKKLKRHQRISATIRISERRDGFVTAELFFSPAFKMKEKEAFWSHVMAINMMNFFTEQAQGEGHKVGIAKREKNKG